MTPMALLLGVLIGLALGLTGAGGSVIGVPLLHYGLGMGLQQAISVSLLAVALVAGLGVARSLRSGWICWRAIALFGSGSVLVAPLAGWLAGGLDERLLVPGFALIAAVIAIRMYAGGATPVPARASVGTGGDAEGLSCRYDAAGQLRLTAPCSFALLFAGLLTGVLSGVFGVGGGFLIVPALVLITQMSVHAAVANSLVLIALTGGAGFAGRLLLPVGIPWPEAALYVAGGALGMLLGQGLARRVSGAMLQRIFALLLLLVAAGMAGQHLFGVD